MPTGLTSAIYDGKDTTLRGYILRSARSRGFLITMRDSEWDAEIPRAFEPEPYHRDALAKAKLHIKDLYALDEEQINLAAESEYQKRLREWTESKKKNEELRSRYEAMIARVEAWDAPELLSSMKADMLKMLVESMDFDVYDYDEGSAYFRKPERKTGDEWYADQIASASRNITHHTQHWQEEQDRTADRNRYLAALWESLPDD